MRYPPDRDLYSEKCYPSFQHPGPSQAIWRQSSKRFPLIFGSDKFNDRTSNVVTNRFVGAFLLIFFNYLFKFGRDIPHQSVDLSPSIPGPRLAQCKRPKSKLRSFASYSDRGHQERSGHVFSLASSGSKEAFPVGRSRRVWQGVSLCSCCFCRCCKCPCLFVPRYRGAPIGEH